MKTAGKLVVLGSINAVTFAYVFLTIPLKLAFALGKDNRHRAVSLIRSAARQP
jgi:hypothetical protein